ncbi:UNVERIFIED_CONTAM: hypothetical protein H355_011148 [Colinus virginianus]|nr:hypothetical protein H355_011148 [Colinus virginianus]
MLPVATAMPDDTPMFDPSILHELDWSENTTTFSPSISPSEPGDGLVMRPLCTADLNRATAMPDDTPMFDPSILHELDWSENTTTFSPSISPSEPGDGLVMRPLCTADLNRGFFKVLGQLTETGVVSPEQFIKTFEHMKKSGDYYVTVVEDTNLGQIVATATLVIEHKFTHSCAKIVQDLEQDFRLTSTLTLLSKRLNCYKITLECLPKNVAFYKKFGYLVSEENYMFQRFFN